MQALATWLALLGMTFWLGGLIWETWVLTPGASDDPDLARASWAASRRFHRLVPYALGTVSLSDVAWFWDRQQTFRGAGRALVNWVKCGPTARVAS
jgi:putative copper export protein